METNINHNLDNSNKWRQAQCFVAFHWINLSVGLNLGLGTVQYDAFTNGQDPLQLSEDEVTWVASIGFISAILGHLLGGVVSNKLGRKTGALICCPIFCAGFLFNGVGPTLTLLLVGKILHGLANGMQHTACASYYSEVTSPRIRTAVHCMAGVFNCVAILLPVIVIRLGLSWRLVCYVGIVLPVLGFLHIRSAPESPAWLVMRGKVKEALRSIVRLRGPDYDHCHELEYLERSYDVQVYGNDRRYHICRRLRDPDVWKPFLIVNALFIIQVWSGLGPIRSFLVSIIRATGTSFNAYSCAMAVSSFRIIGQFLSSILSMKFNRRPILIWSCFLLGLSWIGLGLSVDFNPYSSSLFDYSTNISTKEIETELMLSATQQDNQILNILPVIFLMLLIISFQAGLGPTPWVYGNELYPLDLRSYLCAITSSLEPVQVFGFLPFTHTHKIIVPGILCGCPFSFSEW